MSRPLLRAALVACAAAVPSLAAAQTFTQVDFDLASSFLAFNTPGSPFTAGYYANYGDPLTPFRTADRTTLTFNNGQQLLGFGAGGYATVQDRDVLGPGLYYAATAVDDPNFSPVFEQGELGFHPGPGTAGAITVVRFTAPFSGTYFFSFNAYSIDPLQDVTGLSNANVVTYDFATGDVAGAFGGSIGYYRADQNTPPTEGGVDLLAGQYFDIAVDDANDGATRDMTAFNLQITGLADATTVPEPATVALVGAGVLALGAAARRRRQA